MTLNSFHRQSDRARPPAAGFPLFLLWALIAAAPTPLPAQPATATNAPGWLTQPLSLVDAINVALESNGAIRQARADLEATHGVIVQTRAIAYPRVRLQGNYEATDAIESLDLPEVAGLRDITLENDQRWSASIRVIQSLYEGGRISSSRRAARLTKQQSLAQFQTVVADALFDVKSAYYDVLLAEQQIVVQEASLALLTRELADAQRRFAAGTVPRFNVLRAEVELANARPRLIRARNAHRIAKNRVANLLGHSVPPEIWEDLPLRLTGTLETEPFDIALPAALARALEQRPELEALRRAEALRREDIVQARAGYKPSFQVYAGYGSRSSSFVEDLTVDVSGWVAGAQLTWDIFDGRLTRGRVLEAEALRDRARVTLEDTMRQVDLEVRTAYSQFIEARELLESQKKVQEQAEEALRLANSRAEAGTGTQLDVLGAQTALTEARTTQIQARHDYAVARARLERAIGEGLGARPEAGPRPERRH